MGSREEVFWFQPEQPKVCTLLFCTTKAFGIKDVYLGKKFFKKFYFFRLLFILGKQWVALSTAFEKPQQKLPWMKTSRLCHISNYECSKLCQKAVLDFPSTDMQPRLLLSSQEPPLPPASTSTVAVWRALPRLAALNHQLVIASAQQAVLPLMLPPTPQPGILIYSAVFKHRSDSVLC